MTEALQEAKGFVQEAAALAAGLQSVRMDETARHLTTKLQTLKEAMDAFVDAQALEALLEAAEGLTDAKAPSSAPAGPTSATASAGPSGLPPFPPRPPGRLRRRRGGCGRPRLNGPPVRCR